MKLPLLNTKGLAKPKESKLFLAVVPVLKEKRAQQYTTIVLSLITIAFFGLFAINPTFGTIVDLQRQLNDSTFVDEQLQKKIANLTNLQTQYTKLQPQLDPILNAVPTTPDIGTFVGQIHQIALQTNVQINRTQTFPVDITRTITPPAKSVAYAFTIEGQGLLPNIESYIEQLGNFNRLISFDTVNYTRVGRIDQTFRLLMRGKTYFKQGETP